MKNLVIVLAMFITGVSLFAQQIDTTMVKEFEQQKQTVEYLKKQFKKQNYLLQKQKQTISLLLNDSKQQRKAFDSLANIVNQNSLNINKTSEQLGVKIENTQKETTQNIVSLSDKISKNMLYWIIAVLLIIIALIFVFIVLRKQIFKQKNDINSDIEKTRKALEQESIKLDNKLIELLDKQLNLIKNSKQDNSKDENETDHTLALKVADEIVRLEKNIAKMDSSTKGIKPLLKGIERIRDNFKANGYEMVQLLGKEYDDRMKIDVINFIDDDTLPPGKRIITRIIKPQVNYNGVLIQRAQVDVSQN